MAKTEDAIQAFKALIESYKAGNIQVDAIEEFVLNNEVSDTYYWKPFQLQLMDIVESIVSDSKCLKEISQAIESGIQKGYDQTHFRSEDEMLDSLEELFQLALNQRVKNGTMCVEAVICFYALLWNGFSEGEIRELRKDALDLKNNVINFKGHAVSVSQRVMDLLYGYAQSEGVYRLSNSPLLNFYRYMPSEYLFRTYRSPKFGQTAFRILRNHVNDLSASLNFHHRFKCVAISINGAMKLIYDWEKKTEIMVTARSVVKNDIPKAILGEKIYFYNDLFTIVSKYYEEFRFWMDTNENKIE